MITKSIWWKVRLLLLLCIVMCLHSIAQEAGCKSVHEGKFRVTTKETGTTVVTRTKAIQTEENESFGVIMTFDITWIDDCTYTLRPKKVLKGDPRLANKNILVTVRIKDVNKNSYQAETTSNFSDVVMTMKVEIL